MVDVYYTAVPLYSSTTSMLMQVNKYVCWQFICRPIWVWTNTFPVSSRRAFIISANLDVSGARSTLIRRRHLCMPSSRRALTIANLQRSPRRGSRDNHRQATSVECCRPSRQWHQEVRPRTFATDAPGVTLAGHPWASQLQVGDADSQVSARQSTSVPVQLLYPGRPSRNTSASAVCYTSSADRSATSSQHLRSSGIRCRWSDDVQHSAK